MLWDADPVSELRQQDVVTGIVPPKDGGGAVVSLHAPDERLLCETI